MWTRTPLLAAVIVASTAIVFLRSPAYIFSDSHFSLLLSRHILHHGDIRLDRYLVPPLDPRLLRHRPTPDVYQILPVGGHSYYRYPIGSSVLSMPFVPLLEAGGWSPVRADGGYDVDGELAMQRRLASVLMASLAGIFFVTARMFLPPGWSIVVALGGALGTQVWSTASRVLWSHTWGILLVGVVVLLLVAKELRRMRLNPYLLATILTWAYLVRPVNSIAIATVSAFVLLREFDVRWFVRFVLTIAAWLLLLVAYSYYYFDQFLPWYYRGHGFDVPVTLLALKFYVVRAAGHLVSPSRGLIIYVPVVVFVVYLVARYRRTLPSVALTVLGAANIVALLGLMSGWRMWWGGHSYGPRLLTECVPWLVLLAVMGVGAMRTASAHVSRGRRRLELAVGAVLMLSSVAIQARGALSWDTVIWNYYPVDVDRRPSRLWDWSNAQLLAGDAGSLAEVYDPRRR